MKKRIGIIMIMLIVLSGCTTKPKVIFSEVNEMEYGEDPMQLITETDAEEIAYAWKDVDGNVLSEEELKTDMAYQLVFTAYKENKEMEFTKEITLIDTTAPTVEAKEKEIIIEYGSEEFDLNAWIEENVSYNDNYSKEVKITLPEINTTQEDTVSVSFYDEHGNVAMLELSVKLEDTTAPVITAEKTEFSTTVGQSSPQFEDYATAFDLKDGEVPVLIENDWNSKKAGVYNLLFVAIDKAGNRAELPFTYTVKSKTTVSNSGTNKNNAASGNNGNNNSSSDNNAGSDSGWTGWIVEEPTVDNSKGCQIRECDIGGWEGGIYETMDACKVAGYSDERSQTRSWLCGQIADTCDNPLFGLTWN